MLVDVALLLATGLCAGAAVYVSLVEHLARVAGGTALVGAEFRPSSRRGAVMRASLAALAAVAGIGDWARGHGALPLPAGLVMVFLIAFTLGVILPTNKRLMDPALDVSGAEAPALLVRVGRLHAVRTAAGLVALLPVGLHQAGTS
jgi:hypothetical protein